jgi:hypothetical protein
MEGSGPGANVPVYFERGEAYLTPELKNLGSLWHSKSTDGRLPTRSDFSLRELKSVLRNLAIMDASVEGGRMRFFVRFMGSELDTQLMPLTGHHVDEVLPEYFRNKWQALWQRALDFPHPTRSLSRAEFRERQYAYVESLYCPLADDARVQSKLMAAVFYHQIDAGSPKQRALAEQLKNEFDAAGQGDRERY